MAHWRTLLDSDVLRFVDLDGRDFAVQIIKVKKGKITGAGGKSSGKAILTFEGWPKPLGCGSQTLSQIAAHFGNDVKDWVGKWITIWPDPNVKYGGEAVGGVRVRNRLPTAEEIEATKKLMADRAAAAKAEPAQKAAS